LDFADSFENPQIQTKKWRNPNKKSFLGSHFLKKMETPYNRYVATWFLCCGRILRAVCLLFVV
jgi:hypothetical protein